MGGRMLHAPTVRSVHGDKRDITATDNLPLDKRGLDVNIVNPAPVEIVNVGSSESVLEPGAALSVVKDTPTDLVTYVVPVGKKFTLRRISASGNNVSVYSLYINNVFIEEKHSWWTRWDVEFDLDETVLDPGDEVRLEVEHDSINGVGDYKALVKGSLRNG
jgi:hypothetical protein